MKTRTLIVVLFLAVLVSACSQKSSLLTAGYDRTAGHSPSPNAEKALAHAAATEHTWLHEIGSRGRRYPQKRFSNPSKAELIGDLRALANKNDFDIVSVRLPKPRQIAPMIVVRTKHYLELAQATPAILHRIDPREGVRSDSQGWKYEGFYFEARDEHGVPFLIAFNFERGPSAGGGQWARSEPLYPFAHG